MKKNIFQLLLFILAVSNPAWSQDVSHATIYSEDQDKFTVYLNGEQKNETPESNVRIINLTQRYYKLKILFEDASLKPIEKNIWNSQDSNGSPVDATFEIVMNKKGEPEIRWRSQTVWPPYIESKKTVVVVPASSTTVQQTTVTNTTAPSSEPTPGVHISTPMGSISINNGSNTAEPVQQQTTTTTVYSSSTPNTSDVCTGTVMGDDDFKDALNAVSARGSEEGKLLMAKQIMSASCMASTQVKMVLEKLTTEESRLDLAKFAYARTVDKGNYYKINTVFKNESSVDELNKAIIK